MKAQRVVLLALGVGTAGAAPLRAQAAGRIDSMLIRAHTYFLSHDLLEGRGTARRGNDLSALYLASQAEALGLRGAAPGGGFYQEVPLVEALITAGPLVSTLSRPGPPLRSRAALPLLYPRDFMPNVGTALTMGELEGELAWVEGARDVLAHPERLPDLRGRVALMRGVFGPEPAAADTLRARGAVGVVHLLGDANLYELYRRSRTASRMYIGPEVNAASSYIPSLPSMILGPAPEALLAPALDSVLGESGGPFVLEGWRLRLSLRVTERRFTGRNVAALLPGAGPHADEFVVYTAHHDHLGISVPDERGDSIYNGFSDNAAGSAMLLAIASAMLKGQRPGRSVLFLWLTGEERGLLGSDYFVARPLVPLDRIAGVVNLDAGAPPAPPVRWRISGGAWSTLGETAVEVARRAGWEAEPAPATPNSDYFPFLRLGIPAVFLVPGPGSFEGMTTEQSQQLRRRWDRYHEASDHWAPDYPFSGLVRYADYALRLGRAVASGPRPVVRDR
jgi:hypothetical protein